MMDYPKTCWKHLETNRKCFRQVSEIFISTVKLGDKERFDKEHFVVKEPFSLDQLPIYFIMKGTFGIKEQF